MASCGLMLTAVSPGGIGKFHKMDGIIEDEADPSL